MDSQFNFCCPIIPEDHIKSYESMLSILQHGLFSINPINKSINNQILSMIYSPGVANVCMAINNCPSLVDKLTLRGRSVAIVSDGSFMDCSETKIVAILNWFVAQIKFYVGIDAFPFAIRKQSKERIGRVLDDLSTTYGTILYLDDHRLKTEDVPKNTLLLKQMDIVRLLNCEKTDAEITSRIISYFQEKNIKGLLTQKEYEKAICYKKFSFKKEENYFSQFNDGRNLKQHSIQIHQAFQGKIQIELTFHNLYMIKHFFSQKNLLQFTSCSNQSPIQKCSAIVSDGTAILGLGSIGPESGLPVMEGKSVLFKVLGNVDVIPICIRKRECAEETTEAILDLLHWCESINLQDIKSPECFEVEKELKEKKIMPVFHDDQHGTAIICLSALINALKVVGKKKDQCKIVVNGAGAAGITIVKQLLFYGFQNIIVCDRSGAILEGRQINMNKAKEDIAKLTNKGKLSGKLEEVIVNADVFIGVSSGNLFSKDWINKMNEKAIIFAMANPIPEISQAEAEEGGSYIYGSGRSDYKNQINNSLVFPGIFRAIHEHKLSSITEEMKIKASEIIAQSIDNELSRDFIVPNNLDKDVPIRIAKEFVVFRNN